MKFKRILSILLSSLMIAGVLPMEVLAASAGASPDTYELADGSVRVTVSSENGGFVVRTQDGDRLRKDDDNKDLLFHREEYDTSFTSFRVTDKNGNFKDYLFGGDYGFLGMNSSKVDTSGDETGITSVWSVDDLTFTQRIELAGDGSNEHGAVLISYKAETTSGDPVNVKARLLLDTALGESDFAYYEVVNPYGEYRSIDSETVLTAADHIPKNFFGYDDSGNPTVAAYHISVGDSSPYQLAFAHWNSLASSLFDFAPDTALTFSNVYNGKYLTADSAVGMYFDLGDITAGSEGTCATYYGVYSNKTVEDTEKIAINATALTELELTDAKNEYKPGRDGLANGIFEVQTQLQNFESDTAKQYGEVTLAIYTSNGITPLDSSGNPYAEKQAYLKPYTFKYQDFEVGQLHTTTFGFRADVGAVSEFRKIEFRAFDTTTDSALTTANLIGTKSFYILCPGGNGKLPEILFTSMSPRIVYNEGQRNLFAAGKNFNMLIDSSKYEVKAYSVSDPDLVYDIPAGQVVFSQDDNGDTMNVTLSEPMATGTYQLKFNWLGDPPSGMTSPTTAPCLTFTVSDDKQYKNDYYGLIAVVQQGTGGNSKYSIKTYKTEEAFEKEKSNFDEVLLLLKGEFEEIVDEASLTVTSYRATSVKNGGKASNVVLINDCIDFENGVVTVKPNKTKTGVIVEFDGDLYTAVKRSKIWSGEATFTEITDGTEYDLVPYNSDGERMQGNRGEEITLLWPCGLGIAQSISGMAFNLTFGSLGIIYDTNSDKLSTVNSSTKVNGRVISFSASLDLSFLVPNAGKSKNDERWEYISSHFSQDMTSNFMRDKWRGNDMLKHTYRGINFLDTRNKQGQGSVMIQDILYGCGKGLLGVNFDVELAVPGYFDAMPAIMGHLAVNTIGGFEVGVDGLCQFGTLEIEASIKIKDYKGAPIPDKLYFAIMGFEPGINVDGFGVLWLTGGGGGIDKLYDTMFGGSSVPPLKILLTVSFDILKVLAARVDLSLSLRGISLTARDVRVKYFDMKVLNRLQLTFEWYPEFYFMASVDANVLGIIRGQGYIVIMSNEQYDAFVEFFIRASVQVPDEVPILGGISIGGADLGANNEKIWGVLRALGLEIGITYYWGGNVEFGTGSAVSQPSFPSLLGYEDIPVYYDEERGETLYLRLGSNVRLATEAYVEGDAEPRLMAADRTVKSDENKTTHALTLGAFNNTSAALVIDFPAQSESEAIHLAKKITVSGKSPEFYDEARDNADTATANVVYRKGEAGATGTASVNITFSDSGEFGKSYSITTPVASDLALYDVNPMPSMEFTDASLSGDELTVSWKGYDMQSLDSAMFMLSTTDTTDRTDGEVYPVHWITSFASDNTSAKILLPDDLPSGTYYLKGVYSKEDYVNEQILWSEPITYVNPNQPSPVQTVTAKNGGNYMLDFDVVTTDGDEFDGYIVNVYEEVTENSTTSYELSDITGMEFVKETDENGNSVLPELTVGGYYKMPAKDDEGNDILDSERNPITVDPEAGLAPEKNYVVGVTSFKNITDVNGNVTGRVLSDEVLSAPVKLNTPTPPDVELLSQGESRKLTRTQAGLDDYTMETFASGDVAFTLSSDVPVSGSWALNDSEFGTATSGATISFTNLADGDYRLTVRGEDADGDSFVTDKFFAVDTLPPMLLLSSPVNGSFFDADGSVTVTGVTDADAKFTIYVNDTEYADKKTVAELGGTIDEGGVFSLTLPGNASAGVQRVIISAEDAMGNTTEVRDVLVYNEGFGMIEDVTIYVDGVEYTGGNIPAENGFAGKLTLVANTPKNSFVLPDDANIDWTVKTAYGTAALDSNNLLTVGAGSMGTVTARFHVAEISNEAARAGYAGAMQADLTFGAETNGLLDNRKEVSVTAGVGGTVTGAGFIVPGATVTLTAVPDAGYSFVQWVVKSGNVTIPDPTAATVTFVMPDATVVLEAVFAATSGKPAGPSGLPGIYPVLPDRFERPDRPQTETKVENAGEIRGQKGEVYSFVLPENADAASYAPYYFKDGKKIYVKISDEIIDGKLHFVAPENALYYLGENVLNFGDILSHWGRDSILFCAAREIFNGMDANLFAPDRGMTRGMFVTVLGRLSVVPETYTSDTLFDDVRPGTYYAPYVAWAADNGIVNGYGNNLFGPDDPVTREQMCAIIYRYLETFGYDDIDASGSLKTFADDGRISAWSRESVEFCLTRSFIVGKSGNQFKPQDESTRAEVATILRRLVTAILADEIQP